MMKLMRAILGAAMVGALGVAAPVAVAFELKIVHINDHHSHLTANRLDLKLDGKRTRVSAGGMAAVKVVS